MDVCINDLYPIKKSLIGVKVDIKNHCTLHTFEN